MAKEDTGETLSHLKGLFRRRRLSFPEEAHASQCQGSFGWCAMRSSRRFQSVIERAEVGVERENERSPGKNNSRRCNHKEHIQYSAKQSSIHLRASTAHSWAVSYLRLSVKYRRPLYMRFAFIPIKTIGWCINATWYRTCLSKARFVHLSKRLQNHSKLLTGNSVGNFFWSGPQTRLTWSGYFALTMKLLRDLLISVIWMILS